MSLLVGNMHILAVSAFEKNQCKVTFLSNICLTGDLESPDQSQKVLGLLRPSTLWVGDSEHTGE
jgi:hypothetical protein